MILSIHRSGDGVFVEIDQSNGRGTLFHVTGDIIAASGMRYDERRNFIPGASAPLHRITQIGWILKADYDSGRISTILQTLPTPPKQQGINFWEPDPVTGRHDLIWTKENRERYGPDERRRPTFKCNEWTAQYAIPALRNAGVLRDSI